MNPRWIDLTRMPSVAQYNAAFFAIVGTTSLAAW